MTFKTFVGTTAIACALIAPASFVFADDTPVTPVTDPIVVTAPATTTTEVLSPEAAELAALKVREQDPETGTFMKFILRFKIRQLENQLNIKKALK